MYLPNYVMGFGTVRLLCACVFVCFMCAWWNFASQFIRSWAIFSCFVFYFFILVIIGHSTFILLLHVGLSRLPFYLFHCLNVMCVCISSRNTTQYSALIPVSVTEASINRSQKTKFFWTKLPQKQKRIFFIRTKPVQHDERKRIIAIDAFRPLTTHDQ